MSITWAASGKSDLFFNTRFFNYPAGIIYYIGLVYTIRGRHRSREQAYISHRRLATISIGWFITADIMDLDRRKTR
jgi:hypothetical protein